AIVRDILDQVAGQPDPQCDLVPAGRVHVPHLGVVRLAQPAAVRVPVVVQDDLLVHRVQSHTATPKNRFTYSNPRTSASISSRVVYRWNDARVVAGTP